MTNSGNVEVSREMNAESVRLDWRRSSIWVIVAAALFITLYYGGQAIFFNQHRPIKLVVYGFSTQEEVLTHSVFPAFEKEWEAEHGQDIIIEGVFGPSGTLASQILLGAPADIAILSNEQHVIWLKAGGQVRQDTNPVMVSYTPMIVVTHQNNPWGITDFDDLSQPGLRLIHANPRTSGAGDWALLAEYGSEYIRSKDSTSAEELVKAIWGNVRLMGSSARSALTLFELGAADALVTYEQDALLAQARGVPLEIVIPDRTIVAEHVAVLVDDNLTRFERPVAEDFLELLVSDAVQETFVRYHLRSALMEHSDFPSLTYPFSVNDLGGWSKVYPDLVEDLWQAQIEPRLELDASFKLLDTSQE